MISDRTKTVSIDILRDSVILFLGLNIAWIELTVDVIIGTGPRTMLGWHFPGYGTLWKGTAVAWFWLHFVLVIILTVSLIVLYRTDQR